jgi:hypothetical protein
MSKYHDHRSDCPFKFATLDVCDCVEKNMLDRIEALTAKLATAEELEVMNKNQEAMIRQADRRSDALEAKLAKAVELLKEARQDLEEYVTHEWPKDEHPVYERKWDRDMELCHRIDTTLAEIEGEKT